MLHPNFKSNTRWTVYNLKWMIIVLLNYGCRNMEVLDILCRFIGFARSKDFRRRSKALLLEHHETIACGHEMGEQSTQWLLSTPPCAYLNSTENP